MVCWGHCKAQHLFSRSEYISGLRRSGLELFRVLNGGQDVVLEERQAASFGLPLVRL